MRSVLSIAVLLCSVAVTEAEEAYKNTEQQFGTCVGSQMREVFARGGKKMITPNLLDELLKQKCGFLEERAQNEFIDYLDRQVGRALSPKEKTETVIDIMMWGSISPSQVRRLAVDKYRSLE
jgi:hypothetical protein